MALLLNILAIILSALLMLYVVFDIQVLTLSKAGFANGQKCFTFRGAKCSNSFSTDAKFIVIYQLRVSEKKDGIGKRIGRLLCCLKG